MEGSNPPQEDSANPQPEIQKKETQKQKKKRYFSQLHQDMLRLVARGSAIIAEILRLKDYIPDPYCNPAEEKLYKDIVFDFNYFKAGNGTRLEDKIRASPELNSKDEDFRENNIEMIERFYSMLSSVYQYIVDWKTFIKQVEEDNKYVQYTISVILSKKELRHILCESLFSAGVMLLLVDKFIPSPIREKIMVSYYRYQGQTTIPNFQEMVELFKNTGYTPPPMKTPNMSEKEGRPSKYPVEYFDRCKFSKDKIKQILGVLVDVDIYEQTQAFPNPDHRGHALSSQGSLLLIALFYYPEYLEKEDQKMREIVDKFFGDNWVISFYMGYTIDLGVYWKDFKSAKKALDNCLNTDNIKLKKNQHKELLMTKQAEIKQYLNEGIMTEEYVLNNIEKLLDLMRQGNVALRWFILQRTLNNKKYRELICNEVDPKSIINLLLQISQFEYLIKTMFQNLVGQKDELWSDDKAKIVDKMTELTNYFEGKNAFGKDVRQGDLASFFTNLSQKVNDLNYNNAVSAGRKISQIKEELEGVSGLYHIMENDSAKQNIKRINEYLDHMIRVVSVKKSYLISISKISDFAYAWINIQDYASIMQQMLKDDSKNVLLLRATFLKLASILNFPLIRLFEIESEDIESVTNYYSGELVNFVKDILQIIPISVFNIMNNIINIFNSGFNEMPIKVDKSAIKNYTQSEKRFQLAHSAHKISLFTKGIYLMEKTLMGVIEVDPKSILEEGIRKELVQFLAKTFDRIIDFGENDTKVDLAAKLTQLNSEISSIKRAFLYIQDYININGSRMWCEEMHKMMNYYVEVEANKFLSKKIKILERGDGMSKISSIPHFPPKKGDDSVTFLGRITRYIINLTRSSRSVFYPANYAWYTSSSSKGVEIFGIRMLNMLKHAIGIEGFQSFGKLLGYINYQKIYILQNWYNKEVLGNSKTNTALKTIAKLFGSPFTIHYDERESYSKLESQIKELNRSICTNLTRQVFEIGQIELLRQMQNYSLSENAEIDSYIIASQVKSMNQINLLILKNFINLKFDIDPAINTDAFKKNQFTETNYYNNLCSFFEDFGLVDTQHTFYFNLSSATYLPLMLAASVFNEIFNSYGIDKKTLAVKKTGRDDFDMFFFTYGIYSILYQMGKNNIILFITLISQLLRIGMINKYTLREIKELYSKVDLSTSSTNAGLQMFLQELASNCNIDFNYFEINFNSYLMFRNIAN